ncbi:tetratricopeptide repeat protein [Mesorhizobium sophorae]|uniref:tetratricopeptide repeat protein n=1 Tax=Mesorhizobium sophorae TaxID=1300294 RepID=UPI00142D6BD8|nr:BTAD domain-containing putative transcriptional regulator [Mesorhizobium sophorae]
MSTARAVAVPQATLENQARKAFAREDWQECLAAFEAVVETGALLTAPDRLMLEIAGIRSADADEPEIGLDAALIREAKGEAVIRRYLVKPFHKSGRLSTLAAVLEKLLVAYPHLVDARRMLASALGRLQRWDEAIAHVDTAAAAAPDDISLEASRIQYRLLARQIAAAADLATHLKPRLSPKSREAYIVMMALLRGGLAREAAEIAVALNPADFPAPHLAAIATEALVAADMTHKAIAMGEAAIAAGHDSGVIRAHLGEAILATGRPQDVASRGVEHLRAGVEREPEHGRINALYGEVLLRAGRHEDAVLPLQKAIASEMKSPKTRNLYARALRYSGRYEECADQYVELLRHAPESWSTHRQAVGALCQAGRRADASNVFKAMITKRAAALAPTFEEALSGLDNKLDSAKIPQARLEWAWRLSRDQNEIDRTEWERRARWGLLADLLIIDWLECREQQAEEAMTLLADLTPAEEALAPYRGRGFVVATAHVGPMFSGPILLELLGLPSRWVASTPSIADAHYASSVISTSDQTDSQVVKACLKALDAHYAVAIAVDGSGRIGSPTIRFEGQDITYSGFAARAAHRAEVPSIFYAPRWHDGRIECMVAPLPSPLPNEDVLPFAERWRAAYLANLRTCLAGPPENLRFAGGLWSCIRPIP